MKHILYSNYFWENDENGRNAYDYAKEYLFEEYAEAEGWETKDDIADEEVTDAVYLDDEINFDNFKCEFDNFLRNSQNGFLLCGTCGRWDGIYTGGCYVNEFEDLYKFWQGCDYIKVYDKCGHLYIKASHHDGNNYAEFKELTDKGAEYKENHYLDNDEEVHKKLFNSNFFTRLPHYAHKVWGCKKGV